MPHADPVARRAYQREYQRRWARENRERRLEYERSWNERNREKRQEIGRRTRAKAPIKTWCRNTLQRAINTGKVDRGICEICGAPDAQAHHDDYTKPFEMRWFCRRHHMALHRKVV